MKKEINTIIIDNWKACEQQNCFKSSNLFHSAPTPSQPICTDVSTGADGCQGVANYPTKNLQENMAHLHNIHIVPSLTASRCRQDGTSMVRLQVNYKCKTAYIPTNVWLKPSQWDKRKFAIGHPYADSINGHIRSMVAMYEDAARQLVRQGSARGLSAIGVRDALVQICQPVEQRDASLIDVMVEMADTAKAEATKRIFSNTIAKLRMYGVATNFEMIDTEWLTKFDAWLSTHGSPSRNARNIHLRNIRRAFNKAIQEELTTARYPFKSFSIRPEPTPPSAYTIEELRTLLGCEDATPVERYWLDMLTLSFLLIGINMADIAQLEDVRRGRINYTRKKTGKAYTIKVSPMAMEIINRHRSEESGRLLDILDIYQSVHTATNACAKHLKALTTRLGLPHASWYTARYTWASIAANECNLSVDTIALALGHTYGLAVTLGYISPDMGRVDKANEQVIVKVFGE